MSEEKNKTVRDQLARLLEAAYVLQRHNRELEVSGSDPEADLGPSSESPFKPPRHLQQLFEPHDSRGLEGSVTDPEADLGPPPESPFKPPRHLQQVPEPEPVLTPDFTFTLAQIVGTQRQIHERRLGLDRVIGLVAERVPEIAKAGGAAVALLDDQKVRYSAAAGRMTLPAGAEVPMEKALCVACLRTGQVLRCPDVNAEFLLDYEECQRRGIQALIAVPIFHDGGIAGGLELYFSSPHAFTEQDVHTCQMMAALVTESLGRKSAMPAKSTVSNYSVKVNPAEQSQPRVPDSASGPALGAGFSKVSGSAAVSSQGQVACRKCGHRLMVQEQFCGSCGSPRSGEYAPPVMQTKPSTRWHTPETLQEGATAPDLENSSRWLHGDEGSKDAYSESGMGRSIDDLMPETLTRIAMEISGRTAQEELASGEITDLAASSLTLPPRHAAVEPDGSPELPATVDTVPEAMPDWSSAAAARTFLEQFKPKHAGAMARFWRARRGDVYLAIAVILVAFAIRWGVLSSTSVSATGKPTPVTGAHRRPDPEAGLSLFEKMLVRLGLAEPPPPLEYRGNPDTEVWVDVQTALYYCPGMELYGKTPKGRFASQRSAQLDQFEPAARKACD